MGEKAKSQTPKAATFHGGLHLTATFPRKRTWKEKHTHKHLLTSNKLPLTHSHVTISYISPNSLYPSLHFSKTLSFTTTNLHHIPLFLLSLSFLSFCTSTLKLLAKWETA